MPKKKQIVHTDAENFFSQPEIIREEALFQGISRLQKGSTIPREVKRLNIRRFSRGEITAADLGPVRLRNDSGRITSTPIPHSSFLISHSFETSFSLLINTPGLYRVKEVTIEVKPYCNDDGEGGVEKGFFAFLPFVLRPALKEDNINTGGLNCVVGTYCAFDRFGVAAVIDVSGVLAFRDETSITLPPDVFVLGGFNV